MNSSTPWSRILSLVVFAAIALLGRASRADDRPAARAAMLDGTKAFRLGDFGTAIDRFKESYALFADPLALYNIAQVYRQLKETEKAIFYYEQYLTEAPHADDRAKIEQRVAELKEVLATQNRIQDAPPDGVTTSIVPPPLPSPREEPPAEPPGAAPATPRHDTPPRPGGELRTAAILSASVGVASLAVGLYFGLKAQNLSSRLEERYVPADADRAASAKRNMLVSYGVGGAALAAGGVLFYLSIKAGQRDVNVAIAPRGVNIAWGF